MTDTRVTKDGQRQAHVSRARRFRLARLGFAILAMVFLTGSTRSCGDPLRPPTITCRDRDMVIEPGTCVTFSNPCHASGRWVGPPDYDGVELCPTQETEELFGANPPYSVRTTRTGGDVSRSICVRPDSPLFASLDVEYRYGLGANYGNASIYLTVAPPLIVEASARPTSLALGETSQLVAIVRGGIPPYFYSWIPTSGLNDTDIAAPRATPFITTEYRVRVTDSGGQEEIRAVTVSVGTEFTVTAHPPEIVLGDAAQLIAAPEGGTPPYTFTWTPADTLDDPSRQDPIAAPTTTTTYQVTARDSAGAMMTGSATVRVRLEVTATAEPQEILAGETAALLASPRGGTPPYTFTWTPADTLDDATRQDPIAAPTTAATYQVIARDSAGAAAAASLTILVVGNDPPPTASFVFAVDCCPRLELDASASTGQIVTYAWDLGWTSANPDRITTSPTTSFTIREFDRGPITLTVTIPDGRTATAVQNF